MAPEGGLGEEIMETMSLCDTRAHQASLNSVVEIIERMKVLMSVGCSRA